MDEKLVTIGQFGNYIEADLARQTLEDYGIKAVVTGDNTSNVYGAIFAIERPCVQVLESRAEEAKCILEEAAKEQQQEQ